LNREQRPARRRLRAVFHQRQNPFQHGFRWGEDALRVETEEAPPLRQWSHVAVIFDGLKSWEDRLRIFVNGREAKLKFNQRNFFQLPGGSGTRLKIGAGGGPQFPDSKARLTK